MAGLIPRLRKDQDCTWNIAVIRPGDDPIYELVLALVSTLELSISEEEKRKRVRDRVKRVLSGREPLRSLVVAALQRSNKNRFLLFVDQWEELYVTKDETLQKGQGDRFIDQILEATVGQEEVFFSILLAFRPEFYGQVLEHPKLGTRLDQVVHAARMGRPELRKAIEEPAKAHGLSFEKGLVTSILDDVETQRGPSQLPLLEFALTELWKRRTANGQLLRQAYEDLGSLQGALAKRADEATSLESDSIARNLFLRLIHVEREAPDSLRRVRYADFADPTRGLIDRMVNEKLLVLGVNAKTGDTTVEIAHEALLYNWRRLQSWLAEDRAFLLWRERLEIERVAWEQNNCRNDFLLSEGPRQEADHWYKLRPEELSQVQAGYIERSISKWAADSAEAQRRQIEQEVQGKVAEAAERRRKLLVAVVLTVFPCVVLLAFFFWHRAHSEREISTSRTLASQALQLKDSGLDTALQVSLAADQIADTTEARSSLLTLLQEGPQLLSYFPGDRCNIYAAAFDSSGDLIASGGLGKVFLWRAGDPKTPVNEFDVGGKGEILSLAFSPDGGSLLSTRDGDDEIRRHTIPSGQPLPAIKVPIGGKGIHNLTFSHPDGKFLAYSVDKQVFVGSAGGDSTFELNGHKGFVSSLAFSPNGKLLASSGLDKTVIIWSVPEKKEMFKLDMTENIVGVAFRPGHDDILALAGSEIQLWDLRVRKPVGPSLKDNQKGGTVMVMAFRPDGQMIAAAGVDHKIRLWALSDDFESQSQNGANSKPLKYLQGHGGTVWSLDFSKRGTLLSSGANGEMALWDIDRPPLLSKRLGELPDGVKSWAIDPQGAALAVGGNDGKITVYDAESWKHHELELHHGGAPIKSLLIDQAGSLLVSGDEKGRLLLWKGETYWRDIGLLNGGSLDPIESLALAKDKRMGAVGTRSGRIFVWYVDGNAPRALQDTGASVVALAFDPASDHLISAGGRRLDLWDPVKGVNLATANDAHDDTITTLSFHPEGGLLASSSLDGTVRFWQAEKTLQPQGGALPVPLPSAAAWSHDGRLLAVGGTYGAIALVDVKERRLIGSGLPGTERISCLAFREDGHLISCAKNDLLEWDLEYDHWRSHACKLLNRSLSRPEWKKYIGGPQYRETCGK
jgi:WD40 repeat protein